MRPLRVLSLFDGISCGQVALERAGIPVEVYYASEIDKYAIEVTQKNYPNTIQLGDVTKLDGTQFKGGIDLLIGGSPCQDLSAYKYDRNGVTGLKGSKSSLFFYYVQALKILRPQYFLLENVASMENRWKNAISDELGVQPILINSALVCAAERKRLYWSNIPNITQPEDKHVYLIDIMQKDVADKYFYTKYPVVFHGLDKKVCATIQLNGHRQTKEVYSPYSKCNTILCDGNGGNLVKKVWDNGRVRKLTPLEYERLQTLPDFYTSGQSDTRRYSAIGNGWTVDVIAHILQGIKE